MRSRLFRLLSLLRRHRLALGLGLTLAGALFSWAFWHSLRRGLVPPHESRLIVDREGRYLGEVPGSDGGFGEWPTPYVLPHKIVAATVDTEDRYFFHHRGVYWPSILRAAWQDVSSARIVSGASTLAMQVARLQSPCRHGLLRKPQEAAEALLLIHDFGHERVLRQYLTLAPYGNRVRGVVRAARLYFDEPLQDLSWAQAAFLAGLPQAPGRMNPYDPAGLRRAMARSHRILRVLFARGRLTRDDLDHALHAPLGLVPRPRRPPEAMHAILALSRLARARHETILRSTLDLDLQRAATDALRTELARLAPDDAGNGAVLVIDPHSGEVLAHVGSRDYFDPEHRGAIDYTRTRRSPGSALKPFIYGLALEKGPWTAASELPDTPVEYPLDGEGGAYVPSNINHAFLGPMLLRQALANSRNIPALRVLSDVGVEPALRLFQKAGVRDISFDPSKYGLSLAIGGLDVTLAELVAMYTALADDGVERPLRYFADDPPPAGTRLFSAATADLLRDILSDPEARRPSFFAGDALDFDYAVAEKTGTSQGHRDSWTVAFSDRLLVGVWLGNHDDRPMAKVTGSSSAALVMHDVMAAVMPGRERYRPVATTFGVPPGFVTRTICPLSGQLAGPDCPDRKVEIFAPGTAPTERCSWHHRVRIDLRDGLRAGPRCPRRFVADRVMLDLPSTFSAWARVHHVAIAPEAFSPLCPSSPDDLEPSVSIREPRPRARYLWDPDTPPDASAIRLAADVTPADEQVVWIVDGAPIGRVGWPHALEWSPTPGRHTIVAALADGLRASRPVTVDVDN